MLKGKQDRAAGPRPGAAADPRRLEPRRRTDRRLYPRVHARGLAGHLQTPDGSTPGLAVENISRGGLFVRATTAFPVGTPVMLQLVRPGLKRAIQLVGRVVSSTSPTEARMRGAMAGMGIVVERIDADAKQRLSSLVDELGASGEQHPLPAVLAPADAPAQAAPLPAHSALPAREDPAMALASETIAAQSERIEQLLAEVADLRRELLRRNRTIGDLARQLAAQKAA
ncbi:MAG: PilZ domain-containing protein [Byssovorax sp.]